MAVVAKVTRPSVISPLAARDNRNRKCVDVGNGDVTRGQWIKGETAVSIDHKSSAASSDNRRRASGRLTNVLYGAVASVCQIYATTGAPNSMVLSEARQLMIAALTRDARPSGE